MNEVSEGLHDYILLGAVYSTGFKDLGSVDMEWCRKCGLIKNIPFSTILGEAKEPVTFDMPGYYKVMEEEPWCEW